MLLLVVHQLLPNLAVDGTCTSVSAQGLYE